MTSDQMIKTALVKRKGKFIQSSPDKRGRHKPLHTLNDSVLDSIRDHINSYGPSISHYRRAHAPNRLYLSPEFTIKGMLDDFNEKHPGNGVHYSTYYRIVHAMKISFVKLGEEECETCDAHQQHLIDHHGDDEKIIKKTRCSLLPKYDNCDMHPYTASTQQCLHVSIIGRTQKKTLVQMKS